MITKEGSMGTVTAEAKTGTAATERVVVLMTPDDKAKLEAKAKQAGVSVGELVRRAVEGYDPEDEQEAEIEALLSAIEKTFNETLATMDATEARLRKAVAELKARSEGHGPA
jgi:hypothetical protein